MNKQKHFTLQEMIVVIILIAALSFLLVTIVFNVDSFTSRSNNEMGVGNFMQQKYTKMKDEISNAYVVCVHDPTIHSGDTAAICDNSSNIPELEDNLTVYLQNADGETTYYYFKDDNLYRKSNTGSDRTIHENITGSFTYLEKNVLRVDLDFKTELGESTSHNYIMYVPLQKEI